MNLRSGLAAVRGVVTDFVRVLPQYVSYEVVTRTLMSLVILPVFSIVTVLLLGSRGEGAVTNATLVPFLTSWQGIVFVVLGALLIAWAVVAELGGAITISARARFDRSITSYRAILGHSLRRAPNLLGPGGLIVAFYLIVALPLTGVGLNVSMLSGLTVPRFVMAVIEANPGLLAAYIAVVLVLALVAVLLSYTFPLIVIGNLRAWAAIKGSARLVVRRPRSFLRYYVGPMVGAGLATSAIVGLWFVMVSGLISLAAGHPAILGPLVAFLFLVQQVAALFGSMLLVPFQAQRITAAFYAALPGSGSPLAELATVYPSVRRKPKPSLLDKTVAKPGRVAVVLLAGLVALAVPLGYVLNDLAHDRQNVVLVGHRAGGVGAPENSLAGLRYALDRGAQMVEIDVQRTSDGHYVLNHDNTFARVAGDRRAARNMTLAEVKALRLQRTAERVPTLEEFLVAAQGRTEVIIELKGVTADHRMADDVVSLVDRLGMRGEVILMSLDYSLITYIEGKHPTVVTGFAYFLSIGDIGTLVADVILLEEGEATSDRLLSVAVAGKKSFVWTVNDPETMEAMANRGVDGIITDRVPTGREVIDRYRTMSSADVLWQLFTG